MIDVYKNFISKLEYLNSIIKSHEDKIVIEGLKQLTNLIISDSFILRFLEEQIITFNIDIQFDIEHLLLLTRGLSKYDNLETYQQMLKIMSNIFKKQAVDFKELPLPENIKRIQKLNQTFLATIPAVTIQRLGYLMDVVLGRNDIAEKLYTESKAMGHTFFRIPLKASKTMKNYTLNNKWKVVINTEIEIDE